MGEESQDPSSGQEGALGQEGASGQGGAQDREPAPTADPGQLLSEMTLLRRRTRAARHAYWFPLVLFGLLICASAPFYLQAQVPAGSASGTGITFASGTNALPMLGGDPGFLLGNYLLPFYWLTALGAGLLVTLLWYRRHARQVGLATPARGYVITGAVITVLAIVVPPLSLVPALHWLHVLWPGDLVVRGTFPFLIIAVGLCVLAWAERSPALAVIAVVYTAAALLVSLYDVGNVLYRLGWNPAADPRRLGSLTGVLLPALILLAAGAGAFAAQRRRRATA